MNTNPDKGFNFESKINNIMEIAQKLSEEIIDLQEASKSITSSMSYYHLLMADFSHIREGLLMNKEALELLDKKETEILIRRREVKDSKELLLEDGLLDLMTSIKDSTEEMKSIAVTGYKVREGRKYNVRTEDGMNILEDLIKESAKESFSFRASTYKNILDKNKKTEESQDNVLKMPIPPTNNMNYYTIKKEKKNWVLKDKIGDIVSASKKLADVISFMIQNGITDTQTDVKDHKHSFDELYERVQYQNA